MPTAKASTAASANEVGALSTIRGPEQDSQQLSKVEKHVLRSEKSLSLSLYLSKTDALTTLRMLKCRLRTALKHMFSHSKPSSSISAPSLSIDDAAKVTKSVVNQITVGSVNLSKIMAETKRNVCKKAVLP